MKDRIWRLPPCPPYDVEGMESWLGDMAAQGWELEEDGFFLGFAAFLRNEPAPVRYRLEASPKKVNRWSDNGDAPEREALELNEAQGWAYVDTRGQFFIYRCAGESAPELHTDPQVQALAVKAVEKRQLRSFLFLAAYWLLLGLLQFWRGASLVLFAAYAGLLPLALFLLLHLGVLAGSIGELVYLRGLKTRLRAGFPPDRRKNWKRTRLRHFGRCGLTALLFILFALLCLRYVGASLNLEGRVPLADYAGEPPFATIADFAGGEYRETWKDLHYDYVTEWSNALLERGMVWSENAEVRRPEGTEVRGVLKVDYFAARSEWLAKLLLAECRRVDRARSRKNYEVLPLPDLGLEEQAAYRNLQHFPTVVLRKGNIVVRVMFYNRGAIPLEEWAAILAASLG